MTVLSGGTPLGSPRTLTSSSIVQAAGSNRVNARGSLVVPDTFYTTVLPLVVNVSVNFTDDNGHQLTGTAQVNAQP